MEKQEDFGLQVCGRDFEFVSSNFSGDLAAESVLSFLLIPTFIRIHQMIFFELIRLLSQLCHFHIFSRLLGSIKWWSYLATRWALSFPLISAFNGIHQVMILFELILLLNQFCHFQLFLRLLGSCGWGSCFSWFSYWVCFVISPFSNICQISSDRESEKIPLLLCLT